MVSLISERLHRTFPLCFSAMRLARAVGRVMKFFVYCITTTLPHPELHDKESYVKKTKFVKNTYLEQSRTRSVWLAVQRNNYYSASQMPNLRPIFLLLLISVKPYRSTSTLLTNALANQIAGEQSKSKLEIFSAPRRSCQICVQFFYLCSFRSSPIVLLAISSQML